MSKQEETISTPYEIYPIPHKAVYGNEVFQLDEEITVVFDETIDKVTREKVEAVLQENHIAFTTSNQVTEGKRQLLVGTKDSHGAVEQYAARHFNESALDFQLIDAYQLEIKRDAILILGKDTDASFYGVVTLESILSQVGNQGIRSVSIQDYANTKLRGVIEGYYGIPWSNQDRISLIKFGGKFKANTFVFAPKDDPYHRDRWGELYPAEMLAGIAELAKVGNETKNRFVWTISPLGEVAKIARSDGQASVMALLEENTGKMLRKFDQLYDVGVRQFGVLGDDVGHLPLDYVVQLMKAVSNWVQEKGDVYDTLYCPASYNSAWAWIPSELNAYEKGFAEDVQIFWTGSTTCGPVEQSTIDVFKNKENDGRVRRDPLFWLNWPVNDVDMTRVFLGKGEMLETNIKNLAGVVTNPMQEAEASKISIFAIADYAWNTEDFQDQQSWVDSFKYIEPDATEALHTLAGNMADAHPNGIRVSESEEIKDLLDQVIATLNQGTSIKTVAEQLLSALSNIDTAAEEFLAKTKNEKLKEELTPFVLALRDLVWADRKYIEAAIAVETGEKAVAWSAFATGLSIRKQSLHHERPMLRGTKYAKPAQKRLQPFTDQLEELVSEKLAQLLGVEAGASTATLITNLDSTEGISVNEDISVTSVTNISELTLGANDYIGVKLSRIKELTKIEASATAALILEVSLNGKEWTEAKQEGHGIARYVRLRNQTTEEVIVPTGELKVHSFEIYPKSLLATNYESIENPLALFDGDLATPTFYQASQKEGQFVAYDLGQVIDINNLKVYVTEGESDFPRHAILEASVDNENWATVMTFGDQTKPNEGEEGDADRIDEIFDQFIVPYRFKEASDLAVQARYVRLTLTRSKVGAVRWLRMQEIVINDGQHYPEINDPTISAEAIIQRGHELHYVNDGKLTSSFKPKTADAGSVLYHVGVAETTITGITILEDPETISESVVSVRTLNGWITLGKIETAYQYFDTSSIPDILDLKIEWEAGKAPTIYEVKLDR